MYLKESDFKLSVITDQLNLPTQGVIVIREWKWICHDSQPSVINNHFSETSFGEEDFVNHVPESSFDDRDFVSETSFSDKDFVSETCFSDKDLVDYVSETSFNNSIDHVSETSFGDSDETNCSLEEDDPPLTSTITFKCTGTQHDTHAENILGKVSRLLENE